MGGLKKFGKKLEREIKRPFEQAADLLNGEKERKRQEQERQEQERQRQQQEEDRQRQELERQEQERQDKIKKDLEQQKLKEELRKKEEDFFRKEREESERKRKETEEKQQLEQEILRLKKEAAILEKERLEQELLKVEEETRLIRLKQEEEERLKREKQEEEERLKREKQEDEHQNQPEDEHSPEEQKRNQEEFERKQKETSEAFMRQQEQLLLIPEIERLQHEFEKRKEEEFSAKLIKEDEQSVHQSRSFCTNVFTEIAGFSSQKCIKFVEQPLTWIEAEIYCSNSFNGHLMTVSNETEWMSVMRTFKTISASSGQPNSSNDPLLWWIGLTKHEIGWNDRQQRYILMWEWISHPSSIVDSEYWLRNISDPPMNHNCIAINSTTSLPDSFLCHDSNGVMKFPSICEYYGDNEMMMAEEAPRILSISPDGKPKYDNDDNNPVCLDGFEYWNNDCYLLNNNKLTFFQAQIECQKLGGNLITFDEIDSLAWLVDFLRFHNISDDESIWLGYHAVGGGVHRTDNNTVQTWINNMLFDVMSGNLFQNCASLEARNVWPHLQWSTCLMKRLSVCRRLEDNEMEYDRSCPNDRLWWPANGQCYDISSIGITRNYFDASKYCYEKGQGHLPPIVSTEGNDALINFLYYGLHLNDSSVWLNPNDISVEGTFMNVDGTKFISDQTPLYTRAHCAMYNAALRNFDYLDCSTDATFICQWNETLEVTAPGAVISGDCPDNFTNWNSHCYSLSDLSDLRNYSAAISACQSFRIAGYQTHMIDLDSESSSDSRWLYELIRLQYATSDDSSLQYWWIGSNSSSSTNCTSYHAFNPQVPDTLHSKYTKKKFAQKVLPHTWENVPCSTLGHYVCEAIKIPMSEAISTGVDNQDDSPYEASNSAIIYVVAVVMFLVLGYTFFNNLRAMVMQHQSQEQQQQHPQQEERAEQQQAHSVEKQEKITNIHHNEVKAKSTFTTSKDNLLRITTVCLQPETRCLSIQTFQAMKCLLSEEQKKNWSPMKSSRIINEYLPQMDKYLIPHECIDTTVYDNINDGFGRSAVFHTILKGCYNNVKVEVNVAIKQCQCDTCQGGRRGTPWDMFHELTNNLCLSGQSHIVQCYGWLRYPAHLCNICESALPCIVLEYTPYGTLQQALRYNEKVLIPLHKKKLDWIVDILRGITQMHSFQLIHRDLKPDNILIFNENNEVILKIADVELARPDDENVSSDGRGNNRYKAPDQSKILKSDVYSWALIAIEILLHGCIWGNSVLSTEWLNPTYSVDYRRRIRAALLTNLHIETLSEITSQDDLVKMSNTIEQDTWHNRLLDLIFDKCLVLSEERLTSQQAFTELEEIVQQLNENYPHSKEVNEQVIVTPFSKEVKRN